MSKLTPLPMAVLSVAFVALLTFSSCRKVYDYIRDHPDAHDTLCRITQIRVMQPYGVADTFNFNYNARGNPISMLKSNHFGIIINFDLYFRYDNQDRLTDFIFAYEGSSFVIGWDKFGYPRKNFITDSNMVVNGQTPDGPAPVRDHTNIYGYTMDAFGRIAKGYIVSDNPNEPPVFSYDAIYYANGNQPPPGPGLTYDNKVNLYSTNKIWQFIFKDYSRNNLVPRDPSLARPTYNTFFLPVTYPNIEALNASFFFLRNFDSTMYISYACSMPKGPINY